MKIDGRCHCGEITFAAEVDPTALKICHCTDCQMLSGSAFRTPISVDAAGFVLLTGVPKSHLKTAESGTLRRHAFCGTCGTPVFTCAPDHPRSYSLRVGTIAQRTAFSPRQQSWRRSALAWLDRLADVPASEKG